MSENELYQDYERSIMIQDCNAFVKRIMGYPMLETNDVVWFATQITICLN